MMFEQGEQHPGIRNVGLGSGRTQGGPLVHAGGRMDWEKVDPRPFHHGVDRGPTRRLDRDPDGTAEEARLQWVEPATEVLRAVLQLEGFDGLMFDANGNSMLSVAPNRSR